MSASDAARKVLSKLTERRALAKVGSDGTKIFAEGVKAPITGATTEDALKAYGAMYGSPEAQQKIVKDMAEIAAAKKERQMEEYLAEKAAGKQPADEITEKIPSEGSGLVAGTVKAVGWPQRKLLKSVANMLGQKGSDSDSEESSQQIVTAVADKLGVPESSTTGNVAKALGVGLLEVAADPLGMIPVGKLSKLVKGARGVEKAAQAAKAERAMTVLGDGKKVASESVEALVRKMRQAEAMKVLGKKQGPSLAEQLEKQGAKRVVPRGKIVPSRD